jgi:hypothetical protein
LASIVSETACGRATITSTIGGGVCLGSLLVCFGLQEKKQNKMKE